MGFYPDAAGFAIRTTVAMMLAYFVAFWVQIDGASTAGLCVAIVAQASPGMALSKALYRVIGTLLGGLVAVVITSLFPQDRTMWLATFALWVGVCTFVAALLRDFRSYGAVLCGYTVGLIAISSIDAPDLVFEVAVNRVAATLIGLAAVALVNSVSSGSTAYDGLVLALRAQLKETTALALDALAGCWTLDDAACINLGGAILALRSQASYAAVELPDGGARGDGARSAIAGLLGMLANSRAIMHGLQRIPVDVPMRKALDDAAAALHAPAGMTRPAPDWSTPPQAFLWERVNDLVAQHEVVLAGLKTLTEGWPNSRQVKFGVHYDVVGAMLSASRATIAVSLGSIFCVLSGWSGSTLLVALLAANTALLGMQPNPTAGALHAALAVPLPALAAGVAGFVLLPLVAGYTLFTLTVAPMVLLFSLAARHPRTAAYGPFMLLFFTLLLNPSNPQSFDLSAFLNNVILLAVTVLLILLSFRLILPVSPRRRLFRMVDAIVRDLRRSMLRGHVREQATTQSLQYDRLSQVMLWMGPSTPSRRAVLNRLYAFAEMEIVMDRAWTALDAALHAAPNMAESIAAARATLTRPNAEAMEAAALALLGHPCEPRAHGPVLHAVSGLFSAHYMLAQQGHALRRYGVLEG